MDRQEYISYLSRSVSEYPKPVQKHLLYQLESEYVCLAQSEVKLQTVLSENTSNITTDILDVSEKGSDLDKLQFCIVHSNKAVQVIERWEFVKQYKYSIPCKTSSVNRNALEQKILEKKIRVFNDTDVNSYDGLPDHLNDFICQSVYRTSSAWLFKFNIRQDFYRIENGEKVSRKKQSLLILCLKKIL